MIITPLILFILYRTFLYHNCGICQTTEKMDSMTPVKMGGGSLVCEKCVTKFHKEL